MPEDTSPVDITPPETPQSFEWPTTSEVATVPAPVVDDVVTPTEVPLAATVFGGQATVLQTPPKAPKKKNMIILAAIIVGALALLSGGTVAAYNVWYQNPNKVVLEAVSSLLQQGTSTHKISVDIKTKDTTAKISIDAKLAASPASEANINALISYGGKDYPIKTSIITDKDGNVFLKLNNVKSLLSQLVGSDVDLSAFNAVITKVDSQWIKISSNDLKSVSADYSKTQSCTTTALKSLDEKTTRDELLAVYKKNEFIVVGDKIGVKDIGGVASLGYKVTLDDAKAKTFYTSLGETKVGKALTACDSSINFKPSTDDTTATDRSNTSSEIQVWSSRFGHQFKELDVTTKDKDTTVVIVWNPTFVKGITVETPTQSVPISEVISDIENIYSNAYSSAYSAGPSNTFSTQKQLSQLLLK